MVGIRIDLLVVLLLSIELSQHKSVLLLFRPGKQGHLFRSCAAINFQQEGFIRGLNRPKGDRHIYRGVHLRRCGKSARSIRLLAKSIEDRLVIITLIVLANGYQKNIELSHVLADQALYALAKKNFVRPT